MKRYLGVAAIAAAGVTSVTGTAAASFHEVRTRSWGDTFGGSDAGGTLLYVSSQEHLGATAGNGTRRMYGQTVQAFEASARLIGKKFTALSFDTRAAGTWIAPPGGQGALGESASAEYVVFGKETNATPADCNGYQCASVTPWSTSGTLAEVDRTVVIGFVPVNLRGKLSYSLSTSLDSKANATSYLGIKDSIMARVSSSASASARLSSNFQICSPNCSFGIGGEVNLTIVRASVAPTTSGALGTYWSPTADARYSWTNEGPLTVRVLDGKFSLKIDLGFDDWTWDIYDWDGYGWSETLWSDKGTFTCTDWQSNKGCQDIINE